MKRIILGFIFFISSVALQSQTMSIDPTFVTGSGFDGPALVTKRQPDGKILVGGSFTSYQGMAAKGIIRLNNDGSVDGSFRSGNGFAWGRPNTSYWAGMVQAIALQDDGKILVGGDFDSYNGNTSPGLVRLNSDGTLDKTFSTGTAFYWEYRLMAGNREGMVKAIVVQPNGQIIVGGQFDKYNTTKAVGIIRLNSDGTIDKNFNYGTGFHWNTKVVSNYYGLVHCVVLQPDGNILVGGQFDQYNGKPANGLVRLLPDGSQDNSFGIGTGFNWTMQYFSYWWGLVQTIALQPDGKLIVAGKFDEFNGFRAPGILRLNQNGSFDATFHTDWIKNGNFQKFFSVKMYQGGAVLIGGFFDNINGFVTHCFSVLNYDGYEYKKIKMGIGFDNDVYNLELQDDGKVLIAGSFISFNAAPAFRIARLSIYTIAADKFPANICAGDNLTIPYTVDGTFTSGNLFSAQLSDKNGTFDNPITIGKLPATGSGVINAIIPPNTPPGDNYKIRIASSSPTIMSEIPSEGIIIYPYPKLDISGNYSACRNFEVTYSTPLEPNVEYAWTVSGGDILSGENTNEIKVLWGSGFTGEIILNASNKTTPCKANLKKNITLSNPPFSTIAGLDKVCEDEIYIYTTTKNKNYAYDWSVTGGQILGVNGDSAVKIKWGNDTSGSLTVNINDKFNLCNSISTKKVTIIKKPTPDIIGPKEICEGDTVTFSTSTLGNGNYKWSVSQANLLGSVYGNSVKVIVGKSNKCTISLLETDKNTGCSATIENEISINPQLLSNSDLFNMGSLDACTAFKEKNLDLTNSTSGKVVISSIAFSNSEYSISSPAIPIEILPGETKPISVKYSPSKPGKSYCNAYIYTQSCTSPKIIQVNGEKLQMLLLPTPATYNFGNATFCKNTIIDSVIKVANNGTDQATIDFNAATVPAPYSIVSPTGQQSLDPGRSIEVTVRFAPNAQGVFNSSIILPFSAGTCTSSLSLPMQSTVSVPQISTMPEAIDFGNMISCDTDIDTTVTIKNTGYIEAEIRSLGGADFVALSTMPIKLQPGESQVIKVKYTPNAQGNINTNLTLNVEPCYVQSNIPIKVNKQGLSYILPDTIDCGSLIYCAEKSSQVSFSISNKLVGSDCEIAEVAILGDFTSNLSKSTKILSGETKSFSATFLPTDITSESYVYGEMTIRIEPCSYLKKVILKGTKNNARLAFNSDTLNFGTITEEDELTKYIDLKNTGSAEVKLNVSDLKIGGVYTIASTQPALPCALKPGESLKIGIIYTAELGKSLDSLMINSNVPCPMINRLYLTGLGLKRIISADISIPDLRFKTGERFILPLVINKSQNINTKKTTAFSAKIKYNKTIMAPAWSNPEISEIGGYDYVTLNGDLKKIDTLGKFEFIAALGNDSCTTIQLDTIKWIGRDIPSVYHSGGLCITDICRTCGERYVDPTKKLAFTQIVMEQNGVIARVDFEVNEKTLTQISLFNILGECVLKKDIIPDDFKNNIRKLDLTGITSGVYFIVISNEDTKITKAISIEK